jgi:hypothetical protein
MADEYLHSLTDIWNNGATTFYAIRMNVTDTASASGSKLIDLQVGGVTQFNVGKNGNVVATGNFIGVNGVLSGTLTSTGAATLGGTAIPTSATLVTTTRAVATGTGLTGGGNLSADRTLALTGQALALHNLATSGLIARTGAGTVAGRTLTAGTGIAVTNGDGVSGNPTAALSAGSIASLALADSAVQPARAVNSGTGLTGGGNLSADRTLALTGQALALHNLATSGLIARTGAGTVAGRTLAVSGTGLAVSNGDGVAGNPTITSNATNLNTVSTIVARDASGNFSAGTVTAALSGNATTATTLATPRTIGGVSFDGSANINLPGVNTAGSQNTTGSAATLTTARTLTIGSTGKTFNGSANVSWTLAEIGAAASALTLTAGTGLTGGGNLSANRTIAIAAGGVGTTQIADSNVTTAKIADANVTAAKLATAVARGIAAAWANLNGTGTIALRDSQNVSSVVDNGTGDYTFNFSSSMADVNYKATATCTANSGLMRTFDDATPRTASAFRTICFQSNTVATIDALHAQMDVHGDLA